MADETPDIPAPKKPAVRKPASTGPGAAPRKPPAKKPAATPTATPPAATPPAATPPAATPATDAQPEAPAAAAIPVPPVSAPAAPVVAPVVPPVPTPADAAAAPQYSASYAPLAPAPAKRKIWPFVLGGGILVFILIVVGIVVAVLSVLGGFGQEPKATVLQYDKAYETADCDLYLSTLTQDYKDNVFGGDLDCDEWVDNAKSYTVDGEYVFTVKVVISKVDGDEAQVVTNETDASEGGPYDYTVRYYLVKDGGKWLIDDIQDETPGQ